MRLSILDFFSSPRAVLEAGALADRLGYHRYWIGEHHTPRQCPNPLMMASLLAGYTDGIRVGTGASSVMLRNPLLIAEDARMTCLLFGDRLDLGVAPALALAPPLRHAITEGRPLDAASYVARVRQLHAYVTGRWPGDQDARLPPYIDTGPPLWLLGLNEPTARLAAELGVGFCTSFHHGATTPQAEASIRAYRDAFVPSAPFKDPSAIVVVSGVLDGLGPITSPSAEDRDGFTGTFPRAVEFKGGAAECVQQLQELGAAVKADEVMILSLLTGDNVRHNQDIYRAVAAEWGLKSRGEEAQRA